MGILGTITQAWIIKQLRKNLYIEEYFDNEKRCHNLILKKSDTNEDLAVPLPSKLIHEMVLNGVLTYQELRDYLNWRDHRGYPAVWNDDKEVPVLTEDYETNSKDDDL